MTLAGQLTARAGFRLLEFHKKLNSSENRSKMKPYIHRTNNLTQGQALETHFKTGGLGSWVSYQTSVNVFTMEKYES